MAGLGAVKPAKPTIGYLGMGVMGSAMASRLLDAGCLMVWVRPGPVKPCCLKAVKILYATA